MTADNVVKRYFLLIEKAIDEQGARKHKGHNPAVRVIASYLGLNRSSVYRWSYPKTQTEGLGGHIPRQHIIPLLRLAEEWGIKDLTAEDLLS